jgi:hypothetical protein
MPAIIGAGAWAFGVARFAWSAASPSSFRRGREWQKLKNDSCHPIYSMFFINKII